ncbi:hypothetical protein BVRB_4g075280 [Beta vulgaris subsp. vulgaris]|nr:hypothetical protein BVRB_4g075280 [Beta vulgaris subsp. vulgaris]
MEFEEEEEKGVLEKMIVVTNWVPKLVETQVDFLATTFTSILTTFPTPSFSISSTNSTHYYHPHAGGGGGGGGADIDANADDHHQSRQTEAQKVVRKVGYGVLGAVYAGIVLSMLMMLAVVLGVVLVNYWVEYPVFVREKLHFDYTDVHPQAVFVFGGKSKSSSAGCGVPVGHTFHVSLVLLLPDSDYNRDIGVFQLMAEVVSTNGRLIARSSQPSMLQFHSHPIRLMRTLIMGIPILLGISRETQTIKVQMLQYKEDSLMRTEAVKITLMPRAGTPYLPQIYEAEILMHSKLPRVKELVHNWKWTFYVWTSLYVYAVLLMFVLCFFRNLLVFPIPKASDRYEGREQEAITRERKPERRVSEGREFSETLRKWQQYRRKRKAALLSMSTTFTENVGSTSASSYTITKDDIDPYMEEDIGDSESVCMGS